MEAEIKEFKDSLAQEEPDANLSPELKTLWYDAKDDWDKAHDIAQVIKGVNGSLLHAYLHRKEGDISNSRYWYNAAGSKMPNKSLQLEWEELLLKFIANKD